MTGLDTNVIVRYLTHDDPIQTPAAVRLIDSFTREDPGYLSLVVIVETIWVLEDAYDFKNDRIAEVLEMLLRSEEILIERNDLVLQALRRVRAEKSDFSDCLIERCAHAAGCTYTATFDRRASARAGMHLIV
jgi:predicted nucleic-acid-binding protein